MRRSLASCGITWLTSVQRGPPVGHLRIKLATFLLHRPDYVHREKLQVHVLRNTRGSKEVEEASRKVMKDLARSNLNKEYMHDLVKS